jgi:hypothetical protein
MRALINRGGQKNLKIKPKLNHNQQFWNKIETLRFGSWLTVRFGSVRFNGSFFLVKVMVWFKTIKSNYFNNLVGKWKFKQFSCK